MVRTTSLTKNLISSMKNVKTVSCSIPHYRHSFAWFTVPNINKWMNYQICILPMKPEGRGQGCNLRQLPMFRMSIQVMTVRSGWWKLFHFSWSENLVCSSWSNHRLCKALCVCKCDICVCSVCLAVYTIVLIHTNNSITGPNLEPIITTLFHLSSTETTL